MKRGKKWALGLGIAAAVIAAAGLLVMWQLPSDEELAARLASEAEAKLGVKVTIGSAHWRLRPTPLVEINEFRTGQPQPVIVQRITAYPELRALLHRKIVLESVAIEDAVFPRNSVRAFKSGGSPDELKVERLTFRNLTWISYSGVAVAYDGEVDFDPDGRPRQAELSRPGAKPAFTLTVQREGDTDRWQTRILVGGGTAHGTVALKIAADGKLQLRGELAPHDIEVASALETFHRRSPVSGKGSGKTVLSAEGMTAGELAHTLHTRTDFTLRNAKILRFDVHKAISTRGKEHSGQTPLDVFTGHMETQNTEKGLRVTYSDLTARSGDYSATGKATVYQRHVEGSGTFRLAEGAVGVPFSVSGPVDKPKASMPPGVFAGALIGTKILPGVGTSIGAKIGGVVGKIFKPGKSEE